MKLSIENVKQLLKKYLSAGIRIGQVVIPGLAGAVVSRALQGEDSSPTETLIHSAAAVGLYFACTNAYLAGRDIREANNSLRNRDAVPALDNADAGSNPESASSVVSSSPSSQVAVVPVEEQQDEEREEQEVEVEVSGSPASNPASADGEGEEQAVQIAAASNDDVAQSERQVRRRRRGTGRGRGR